MISLPCVLSLLEEEPAMSYPLIFRASKKPMFLRHFSRLPSDAKRTELVSLAVDSSTQRSTGPDCRCFDVISCG